MANLKVELVKSLNGRHEKHIATANSMGLRKIGDTSVQPDNDQTRGKIAKIGYLLHPESVPAGKVSKKARMELRPSRSVPPTRLTRWMTWL